jgi:hypothetical protein
MDIFQSGLQKKIQSERNQNIVSLLVEELIEVIAKSKQSWTPSLANTQRYFVLEGSWCSLQKFVANDQCWLETFR